MKMKKILRNNWIFLPLGDETILVCERKLKLSWKFFFCWNLIKSLLISFLNLMWFVDGNVIIGDRIWIVFVRLFGEKWWWKQLSCFLGRKMWFKILRIWFNLNFVVSWDSFLQVDYETKYFVLVFGWNWLYCPKFILRCCASGSKALEQY